MTNRPKHPEHAAVTKAVAAATNGHGLSEKQSPGGIVLPEYRKVQASAELAYNVAEAACINFIVGMELVLSRDQIGRPVAGTPVPKFSELVALMKAEWKEPTALQAAKIAQVEELATFQAKLYEKGAAVEAAQAAEVAATEKAKADEIAALRALGGGDEILKGPGSAP